MHPVHENVWSRRVTSHCCACVQLPLRQSDTQPVQRGRAKSATGTPLDHALHTPHHNSPRATTPNAPTPQSTQHAQPARAALPRDERNARRSASAISGLARTRTRAAQPTSMADSQPRSHIESAKSNPKPAGTHTMDDHDATAQPRRLRAASSSSSCGSVSPRRTPEERLADLRAHVERCACAW